MSVASVGAAVCGTLVDVDGLDGAVFDPAGRVREELFNVIFFTGAAELEGWEEVLGVARGTGAFLTGAELDVAGAVLVTGLRGEVAVEATPLVAVRFAIADDDLAAPVVGADVDLATEEEGPPAVDVPAVRAFEDAV